MAWLAVDRDGGETVFENRPCRRDEGFWEDHGSTYGTYLYLPYGTIKALIGRELTWADGPVELKEKTSYDRQERRRRCLRQDGQ